MADCGCEDSRWPPICRNGHPSSKMVVCRIGHPSSKMADPGEVESEKEIMGCTRGLAVEMQSRQKVRWPASPRPVVANPSVEWWQASQLPQCAVMKVG